MQDVFRKVMEGAFGLPCVMFVNGTAFVKDYGPPPPTAEVIEKGPLRIWEDEYVPYIADFCRELRARDYKSMTAPALAAALQDIFAEAAEAFRRTMVVIFPFMGPTLGLVEFSEQALGREGPMLVAELLQGFANQTSAAGSGLGELATFAIAHPDVANALREGRFDAIDGLDGGAEFNRRLGAYLAEYGWRAADWAMIEQPTWAEDRRIPLILLQAYVTDPARSPEAAVRRSVELREAAEAKVTARLSGELAGTFNAMLEACSSHVAISEGRAHWQLSIVGSLRVPVIALGEKLVAAGALGAANDAFYLSGDELKAAAAAPSAATGDLVREHKAELTHWNTLTPPPFIGAPPSLEGAPPEAALVFKRFFGLGVEPSTEANLLNGNAASNGVVTGKARVLRDLSQADGFEPGEILVCAMTAPPWTPLFSIAAAVVTDTGGILSHSAICAREYAIPCVVGTVSGTRQINTGDTVTVDGDRGTVRIHR